VLQGYRKPDPAVYSIAAQALQRQSDELILVDDRLANVEGASTSGMRGIHFQGASDCRRQLLELGVVL
jgi:putative hydrolase of the HAD superfamily